MLIFFLKLCVWREVGEIWVKFVVKNILRGVFGIFYRGKIVKWKGQYGEKRENEEDNGVLELWDNIQVYRYLQNIYFVLDVGDKKISEV